MKNSPFRLSDEVAQALETGRAVVALESTLIAHGLPWPDNLETARESEEAVRRSGAIPATVAVIGGIVRLGLDPAGLERLASARGVVKAGRRDLGPAVAGKKDAATTVSATLHLARIAGIGAMATGGLGGVHRGASETFDESTDLDELARGDGIAVICSGVKSILDVSATLERLETLGVAMVGYRTGEFPAFTTRSSGLPLDWRADSVEEAAGMIREHRRLGLPGAVVLAQPVPESLEIPRDEMEARVATAIARAEAEGVRGKAITPFLLDAIRQATGGRSLVANRALIVRNAALAGEVASALTSGS